MKVSISQREAIARHFQEFFESKPYSFALWVKEFGKDERSMWDLLYTSKFNVMSLYGDGYLDAHITSALSWVFNKLETPS